MKTESKTPVYLKGYDAGKRLQSAGLRPQMSHADDKDYLNGYRDGVAANRRRSVRSSSDGLCGPDERRSHSR